MGKVTVENLKPNELNSYEMVLSGFTIQPEYCLTLTQIGEGNSWQVSGKINGLTPQEAEKVTVLTQIQRHTINERQRHKKGIKGCIVPVATILGILVVGGTIAKLTMLRKTPTEIVQESKPEQPKTITLYAVSTEKNILEYMGNLEGFQDRYGINIATLRGVQSLNDEDFKNYDQNLKDLNTYISEFKRTGYVDLNKFLGTTMKIYDSAVAATEDLAEIKNNPTEENNKTILTENYWTTNIINDKARYLGEYIEDAIRMKQDYPQSTLYPFSEGYAYGVRKEEVRIFSTLEEAKQYQEQTTKEFESHLKTETHKYEDTYYDGHDYHFTIETNQYEAPMTEEEMREAINSGRTYSLKKTKISGDFHTNLGK